MHTATLLHIPAVGEETTRLDSLVERAQAGDVRAFEDLAEQHLAAAYRLAVGLVGPDDARDVAQESLIAAWRMLPKLRDPARFEAWLHTIVINRARNALRSRRRHSVVALDDEHASRVSVDPTSEVDLRMAVESTLDHLKPDVRAVFVLHYVLDLPLREAARILGIREGTAKSRLNAGLTTLRRREDRSR